VYRMEGVIMTRTATLLKYLSLGFVIQVAGIVSTANADIFISPGDSIQGAIDSAIVGIDTIWASPGTYSGAGPGGNYDIDFKGKNVTVQSQFGKAVTTIDCNSLGRAFIFQSGESSTAELRGFTIINGYAEDPNWPQDPNDDASGYGGAIYIKNSSPFITDCNINNCKADDGGGAIFCDVNGNAFITLCDIGFYNMAGYGFYNIDPCDANLIDVNDLHQLGGGIYCRQSSPRIIGCNIRWNRAAGSGGGIACEDSNATIEWCNVNENDCWVDDNLIDQHGGGIYIKGGTTKIMNSWILWNTASFSGGGIAVVDSNNTSIDGVVISENDCWASAGGIYSEGHSGPDPCVPGLYIENCTINHNRGYWSGGISSNYGSYIDFKNTTLVYNNVAPYDYLAGGLECYYGRADGNNNNIWGNSREQIIITKGGGSTFALAFGGLEMADFGGNTGTVNVTYSNVQMFDIYGFYDPTAVWPGEGNINKDPMFVDPFSLDFHLRADEWNTSPCINAGDPFADYSLEPAPNGGRINIGAYGGTGEAASSDILRPVPGDADADLAVNMVDFAILADNWRLEGANIKNEKADADNNGIVDERDLFILQKFWLWLQ